jgi:hypothetical protein
MSYRNKNHEKDTFFREAIRQPPMEKLPRKGPVYPVFFRICNLEMKMQEVEIEDQQRKIRCAE